MPLTNFWPGLMEPAEYMVRLGQLTFRDFLLLCPACVERIKPSLQTDQDLEPALSQALDLEWRFRSLGLITSSLPSVSPAQASAAQERLVRRFALQLLQHKAPPLYDALPWHDWDMNIVRRTFQPYRTRYLIAGTGAISLAARLSRTAGIWLLEPCVALARYAERRAELERIRRLSLLRTWKPIPLPDAAVDLAVVCSWFSTTNEEIALVLSDLRRIALNVLLVENCPTLPTLPLEQLARLGFRRGTVTVRNLGLRPCWYSGPRFDQG